MASPFFLLFLLFLSWTHGCLADGGTGWTYAFDIHHRFSDEVRKWAESTSSGTGDVWPEEGTLHYYTSLVEHDKVLLHRRGLTGSGNRPHLTFADGNSTKRLNKLGFLHYVNVAVGTPEVRFLVALDTGSDLFWVPCDCNDCTPTVFEDYNIKFNIYNTSLSSTSKWVPCNSSLCELQNICTADPCPYKVRYLTPNLSTSGVLVEDVLHMTTEGTSREIVQPRITFGCGQHQTGGFLDYASPNGLFGLGMEKTSVPSILASQGLISNSFSMCFGERGNGRIKFGDKGSSDQQETPFVTDRHQAYFVTVTGIRVQNKSVTEDFLAIVDTGTSFTHLMDPVYTSFCQSFDSRIRDKRYAAVPGNPFEYCYQLSSVQTTIAIPYISLLMKGGSEFPLLSPIIVVRTDEDVYIYCLAITKSADNINIIGQNFMEGLRLVFDRERLVLGWKDFNCSTNENSTITPVSFRNSSAPPPIAAGGNKATTGAGDRSGMSAGPSLNCCGQSLCFMLLLLPLLFLL